MKVILRLALRNLREHKSKSIIIALFVLFGSTIVILGNSFLESVNRGLEKDFKANYTGDVVITKTPGRGQLIDIFGISQTTVTGSIPQLPALQEIEKVQEILDSKSSIKKMTRLISAKVLVVPNSDEMDLDDIMDDDSIGLTDYPIGILFSGEVPTYFDMFSGLNITEGTYPAPGTNEIMMDERMKKGYEKVFKRKLNIGDSVLVAGANMDNVIREAVVCAFFNPPNENSAMFQNIYTNPDFARAFASLTYASSFTSELPEGIDTGITDLSEDDMFGDEDFFDIDEGESYLASDSVDFDDLLGDTTLRDQLNTVDSGAWNFILIKTRSSGEADKLIQELNEEFAAAGIEDRAINWKRAAASYTESIEGINTIFNALIIILAIVVFIIIMNTMTVSVIERTGEIGTMRAIGSEKKFVQALFYAESLMLTVVSSIIGAILAVIIALIFNACNITITNEIAKMILGGGLLHFSLTPKIILSTIIFVTIGSIIANIYPVTSALRITPLKALSKGSE